mmetsp:Transcript_8971/g.20223  ORF Transcript_8971/g.20223 Transcript_8971/m.20223 type:complete len:154 (+) Transcript_8971:209-670(+)
MKDVQNYNEDGWNYKTELHKFVNSGMTDMSFIDAISGIVNRGCHNPPCATGNVDGLEDRRANFMKVLGVFQLPSSSFRPPSTLPPIPAPAPYLQIKTGAPTSINVVDPTPGLFNVVDPTLGSFIWNSTPRQQITGRSSWLMAICSVLFMTSYL